MSLNNLLATYYRHKFLFLKLYFSKLPFYPPPIIIEYTIIPYDQCPPQAFNVPRSCPEQEDYVCATADNQKYRVFKNYCRYNNFKMILRRGNFRHFLIFNAPLYWNITNFKFKLLKNSLLDCNVGSLYWFTGYAEWNLFLSHSHGRRSLCFRWNHIYTFP